MSDIEYRLGSVLKFDSQREKYAVDRLNELSKSHNLGQFIRMLILIVFEDPSEINSEDKMKSLINFMKDTDMTPNAYKYFSEANKKISDMQTKVDKIYDMCLKMYTLSIFNKSIGFEEKSNNMAQAEFIVEKQMNELCTELGLDRKLFKSAKSNNVDEISDDVLEYIIEHYDGVINEIKRNINNNITIEKIDACIEDCTKDNNSAAEAKNDCIDKTEVKDVAIDLSTEFIDNADMSALGAFFGGSK